MAAEAPSSASNTNGTCLDRPREQADSNDYPDMPVNWPRSRKQMMIALVTICTFNDATASTMFAPGVAQVLRDFHSNDPSLGSLMISVYTIGSVAGPLLLAPLSEVYGRCPLMHASNVMFVLSTIISGASVNVPMLMVGRVLMGLAGCIPSTVGGAVVADLMPVEERGKGVALWASGILLGNIAGPIIGGYMTMNIGWRWTFWFGAIFSSIAAIACLLFLRETYSLVLLRRNSTSPDAGRPSLAQVVWPAITRPSRLIIRSPIVAITSLYNSVAFVYMYFLLTTFPPLFGQRYGFNVGEVGLAYLGLGVGSWFAQLTVGSLSDRSIRRQKAKNGIAHPEDRLPPLLIGCCSIAAGMISFGWAVQARVHWAVPIICTALVGFGAVYHLVTVQLYLLDAFSIYTASAVAANVVIRSILGAFLPLLGSTLYARLGYGWGNTCLGCIAFALAPTVMLLYRYGRRIRTCSRFVVVPS